MEKKNKTKEIKKEDKMEDKNKMREIEIEKVVLSMGALDAELEKSVKLLKVITKREVKKTLARKRIPQFGIRPGLEIGCKVTIRGEKESIEILKRLFKAVDNKINKKQIGEEDFSFGIKEYIEIPDMEYQRDIGMKGLNVTVVFVRKGKRTKIKKIKRGAIPAKQKVTKQEILEYLNKNFTIEIIEGKKQ